MRKQFYLYFFAVLMAASVVSCTAPRSVIHSGKVTPKGQFKAGFNMGGNIASEPLAQLDDITEAAVDAIANKEEVEYSEQIDVLSKGLVAYALDPVGTTFDFYLRYGVAERVDVGYKYATGVHVFDAMYQFMGPTGTPENPGVGDWYGSVGLQYSGQSSGIFDKLYLDKLIPVLEFSATRRDIVIPLVFSKSFGPEEEIGNISFGPVYNHTFIKYGFDPSRIVKDAAGEKVPVDGVFAKKNFPSFGLFVNGKIGFKFLYVLPSLTMYYQDYGTYDFLEGKQFDFSGVTIIPSIGLQANFGGGRGARTR
ncbi:hypothetical protein JAO76_18205 [Pontibacter sp. BT310]|uniref:Outer membrane protein beta-barrel domain-containing protein n=1 Tax=Pontibacter populi TaxID=890055 RepID=A0ABS6XG74_9BACT|nr:MULTISPECIES: hypothetical protein [Pontibacter]MBJ6120144.1 hypothetical protein [Pontibacter sp. BT310]MBR0572577.1 hypothetical protein [Microvirga sp. STS03]MBW3366997.1 hypothetical protein [Pontibacter populi]